MAAPSRKRETDCPAVLARHRPTPRPYPVKGAANLSLVRIGKAGARVVQNSLVIDFPRAVIFKTRRYKREGWCSLQCVSPLLLALFRPHAMSDLSPLCAPKRTFADYS